MLPLLPALLLLLLQGPSNVERLAQDGRLPEALNSLNRQMAVSMGAADLAMTSLLSVSNDASLAHALATLLSSGEPAPPAKSSSPIRPISLIGPILQGRTGCGCLDEGYAQACRTRDGPVAGC